MTPSRKLAAPGERGDVGEWRVQEPGVVVADVVGPSAFFGGSWKFYLVPSPQAMRKAAAGGRPRMPGRIGGIHMHAEEVLQQHVDALADYYGEFLS
ncbi:hypothetical protein HBH56_141000 [Parastagonospora nodorum]|uniref:Uncharacterized protein n=1 Tax=Phaeosphaeria nodorum (strain SN15 / ATCC MYA-4574 / FGSC 10173) TaxID=321614 RepID=A0A7U2ERP5_PHANO|nr:hypothetical protein HBH56_141000 [Parastagonospora nodorum]QRC91596.1 hypothetical protein JI435_427160 [Parastagonospora nodorum SN15]KAH4061351.1 hypothetical protein HBH49_014110 [Parastagonospora nodorum]KAH4072906.1 hypothetical protein HBH50_065960 [Parastagonospora nodorum]KAH4166288.1 hypothetical protein HBH43_139120 [Parastagonospora nodorum]